MPNNDLIANIEAANAGNKTALARVRQQLAGPEAAAIIDACGNMAYQAEESILNTMLDQQDGTKECTRQRLQRMRVELGWNNSSQLERVLIERVTLTWLSLYHAELICDQYQGGDFEQMEFNQARVDRTQRRHLAAVKMLATVRKMALPLLVDIKASINVTQSEIGETKPPFANRLAE